MKKNKFVSGLSARLALAVVALTAMFASCSNENIEIEVKPVPAKAVIYPVVIVDGADVTTQATITYSEGNGTYEGTSIPAKAITVTASFDGLSDSKVVNIPALKAGQAWSQTVVFTMNHPVTPEEPEEFDVIVVSTSTTEVASEEKVYDNPTDYWFYVPVTYNQITGVVVTSSEVNSGYADLDTILKEYIESKNIGLTTVKVTEDVPVMSHARLTAQINKTTITTVYKLVAKSDEAEKVLATFTTEEVGTKLETDGSVQIPGHGHAPAGHGHGYSHDHGHGHGNGNAGGGIIFAD